MATRDSIVRDINEYLQQRGGSYRTWYVGIASDPEDRLFRDHSVSKDNGSWIIRWADSAADARQVEASYVSAGTDGGTGGGSATTKAVYAYQKTSTTRP
ncbi:MAG TPA: hypothetical protein QF624_00545 [Dehalococcoidia bacterium]|nr:hypothetical protein [Dehalococcoidia bacterium]